MPFVPGRRPIFIFSILLIMVHKLSMRFAGSALRAARPFPSPDS
jgi:uncharacterized protein YhhL (DUF1145 family)